MDLHTPYRWLVRGARLAAPLFGRGDSKLARGIRGRRGAGDRLVAWGRERRVPERPLVWFHAPSVGEGLQARAVLEALGSRRAGAQTVFTHFSPSAEALARAMPCDAADYLPWDVRAEVGPVIDALRPDLIAFTKTEVWPVLMEEARRRGVPAVLIAATLPGSSSRLRWPARDVLGPSFRSLAEVMAIAEEDARRFRRLGTPAERIHVTGDPGIDSAARRAADADPDAPWIRPFARDDRPVVVAGSTWPPDEEVLVRAFERIREVGPRPLLVVAPHEPDEAHLAPLEAALAAGGWTSRRLGEVESAGRAGEADAVVVDRVGVLAQLYTVAAAAYVGGGFHDEGLHSVLEPAAAGVPVAFGPRHDNARAAGELSRRGGGRVVEDAAELAGVLERWLEEPSERAASGRAARDYIESHLGAADRTAERVLALLP
ncbi:MAG: glycosyltransferase N-terminal domain-containing protein [Gemmatimonadota bacterium]